MKILALEYSSPQRSVAVLNPLTGLRAEVVETSGGQTMRPFAMIKSALHEAGLEREQIECIVVGLGPGSYTGIRAAIALAQGWQLACGVKVLGLSSAAGIAAEALAVGLSGRSHVVIDAQRGEFYLAEYELASGGACEVAPLRITPGDAIRQRERNGEALIGPEVTKWFANGHLVFPRAATLARMAVGRSDFVAGETLEPIYLRETTFIKAPPARLPGS